MGEIRVTCCEDGCEREAVAKSRCTMHYKRLHYSDPTKRAQRREYRREYNKKNAGMLREKHRRYYDTNQEVIAERKRSRRKENPDASRTWKRRTRVKQYRLTLEEFDALLTGQGGVCAVCGNPPKLGNLHIDHCHETGRVRGLLCAGCNTSIGKLGDCAAGLRRAVAYLERHEQAVTPAET